MHVIAVGEGTPVLALHGAYSTSTELAAILEPVFERVEGHRRLYPDLPGMGRSIDVTAGSSAGAVDMLCGLIEQEIGSAPVLLVGHSYGAHLARGLAARLREQALGMALQCPLVPDLHVPDEHVVIEEDGADADLAAAEREAFEAYFVIRTRATVARFRDAVLPASDRFDPAVVEQLMGNAELDLRPTYDRPVLVMTGRHDAWVGHAQHDHLVATYPNATGVLVADAGHALPHEHPGLVAAALTQWLRATARTAVESRPRPPSYR